MFMMKKQILLKKKEIKIMSLRLIISLQRENWREER